MGLFQCLTRICACEVSKVPSKLGQHLGYLGVLADIAMDGITNVYSCGLLASSIHFCWSLVRLMMLGWSGYEHSVDDVMVELLEFLDTADLPAQQWSEVFSVVQVSRCRRVQP